MAAEETFYSNAEWSKLNPTLTSPARHCFAITPDDDNELAHVTRGILVTGDDGDLVVKFAGDSASVTLPVSAGVYPFSIKQVMEATTVTVFGLY